MEKNGNFEFAWNLENSYRKLSDNFYSLLEPARFKKPQMVIFNAKLADEIGITEQLQDLSEEQLSQVFVGNVFAEGTTPLAQAYAGHQFGYFSMLGDGRAMLLGEQITSQGERLDIQLKGSGGTRYSRNGDGRAVLAPMLREYLISEAMAELGVPTTRSLAVVLTGEQILREQYKAGAVLTRVAKSHLRVGTFQFAYTQGKESLKALADYAIWRHDRDLEKTPETGAENRYEKFLERVIQRQAELIAKWQAIGFIHGVMNTDNVTISGETIDYGPCAFMDTYSPNTVFSSIDRDGRYRYENQPVIGQWNISRLADVLLGLLREKKEDAISVATTCVQQFTPLYKKAWLGEMRRKLGFATETDLDEKIIQELLYRMEQTGADYTNTFVRLTLEQMGEDGSYLEGTSELYEDSAFGEWYQVWQERKELSGENAAQSKELMQTSNPCIIPRNHQVELALAVAEEGDFSFFEALHRALWHPYDYTTDYRYYQELSKKPSGEYRTFCGT